MLNILLELPLYGQIICVMIMLAGIAYLYISLYVSEYYRSRYDKSNFVFERDPDQVSLDAGSAPGMQQDIFYEYASIVKSRDRESINTQALIYKHIPFRIGLLEAMADYIPSMSVVLGLLGTFIGLTLAIVNFNTLIDSAPDMDNIDALLGILREPLRQMGAAFVTSIFGVIVSLVANVFAGLPFSAYKKHKQRYFDVLENVLDNGCGIIRREREMLGNASQEAPDMEAMMNRIAIILETGFASLQKDTSIIENAGRSLEACVHELSPVVDIFSHAVHAFEKNVDTLHQTVAADGRDLFALLADMKSILTENNVLMEKHAAELIGADEKLNDTVESLRELIGRANDEYEKNRNLSLSISEAASRLSAACEVFNDEMANISKVIGIQIGRSFSSEASRLTYEIVEILNHSLIDIKLRNEDLESIVRQLKRRIEALQD